MLLELDGERRALRNFLNDLDFGDADFVPAGSALFRADFARDDNAGFLRQAFQRLERPGIFLQRANALDDAGAVTKNREEQFARFPQIVKPALQRDFLPLVLACLLDGDGGHSAVLCCCPKRTVYQRKPRTLAGPAEQADDA